MFISIFKKKAMDDKMDSGGEAPSAPSASAPGKGRGKAGKNVGAALAAVLKPSKADGTSYFPKGVG